MTHRVAMQKVTKKLRRMTAPASIQKNGFMPNGIGGEDDYIHVDDIDESDSSFVHVPYRKRSSQSIFDESEGELDEVRGHSHQDRYSLHDPNVIRRSKLKVAESPTEENGKDGKNPFSFKAFIKKEKRKAVYYTSREHLDSSGMEEEDWTEDMGNQNGTAPQQGGAAPEVSSTNAGSNTNGTNSGSGGGNSSSNGSRANQRRATSPGMPNRARGKAGRSVQSTAGGTPAPPPPTKPNHIQAQVQQQQQAATATAQAKGNEFVDFIYDYATKENDGKEGGEKNGHAGSEETANKKNKGYDAVVAGDLAGHREHVDKKHGRGERARAHTHGHAARKHKSPASKPNTKSTLLVDYIDASHNATTYSPSGLTVPNLSNDADHQFDEFSRPKAATESKPHRERARAHSHGHRKKGSSDSKHQNKHKGNSSSSESSDPVANLLAVPPKPAKPTENGHGPTRNKLSSSTNDLESSRDDGKSHEYLPDVSGNDSSLDGEKAKSGRPDTPPQSSTPPPGDSQDSGVSSAEIARLRQENSKLRRELESSRKASEKDSKKIELMEADIKKLKMREAEDAKTLETMVQHVEANLKRTTERAVTAENTITKLKAEIKQLKGQLGSGDSSKHKSEENKELQDLKEKANAASLKLATAAKEAEANVK
ncbi:uncharacterized protein [Diadema antillarum]|uniref:uncharacterized protein n=1 Tax=Diadema antillarum TaxID=105358 RepID=UPI003A85A4BF